MPTNRRPVRRLHRARLSHAQEMSLRYGWQSRWADAFANEEEYLAAWQLNRDRLLIGYRNGTRPAAWWAFEAPIPYPSDGREWSALYEAGLLDEAERTELLAFWRAEFEKAWQPDFFHCEGPEKFFSGAIARRKHFAWADVPRELVRQWTRDYRRRSKQIRRLAAAAAQPAPAACIRVLGERGHRLTQEDITRGRGNITITVRDPPPAPRNTGVKKPR